jgi:hypothetical protein
LTNHGGQFVLAQRFEALLALHSIPDLERHA